MVRNHLTLIQFFIDDSPKRAVPSTPKQHIPAMFSHAVAPRAALCLFAAAALLFSNGAAAYPNGMFPTPPLGWSGYQALMQGSGQPPPPPHARLRALAHRRVGMPCGLEAACGQRASHLH